MLEGGIIIWLLFAIITAIVAHSKGRNAIGWFIMGFFLSLIGLIILLLVGRTVENEARRNIEVQQRQAQFNQTRNAGPAPDRSHRTSARREAKQSLDETWAARKERIAATRAGESKASLPVSNKLSPRPVKERFGRRLRKPPPFEPPSQ